VALLTLLINAPTTGKLVNYLELASQTTLQKNILVGVTNDLDGFADEQIEKLKKNPAFRNVDWSVVKNDVELKDLKERIKSFKKVSVSKSKGKAADLDATGGTLVAQKPRRDIFGNTKNEVSQEEVLTELRHKFLTIMKSQYWSMFEKGMMMEDSVICLWEVLDTCLDNED